MRLPAQAVEWAWGLLPEMEGVSTHTCASGAHVDELLCAKLQEEAGRLKSIWESKKVIDQDSHALPSLLYQCQGSTATAVAGLVSDLHQDKGRNSWDTEKQK